MKTKRWFSCLSIIAGFMLILLACGGGGGGSSSNNDGDNLPPPVVNSEYTVSGTAYDGLLEGAKVVAKDPNGTVLGQDITGDDGEFEITIEDYQGAVVLEIDPSVGGVDQDTNAPNTLAFSNVCFLESDEANCNLTPLTSFIFPRLQGGNFSKSALQGARNAVHSALDLEAGLPLQAIPGSGQIPLKRKMHRLVALANAFGLSNSAASFFTQAANRISAANRLFDGENLNEAFNDTNFPLPLKSMKQIMTDHIKANLSDEIDLDKQLILSGQITDFQTQEPLKNVLVELLGSGLSAVTNDQGAYSLIT